MKSLIQFSAGSHIWQTRSLDILFGWIESQAGTEEAIEATSWAELACLDDEYEGDGFDLYVID